MQGLEQSNKELNEKVNELESAEIMKTFADRDPDRTARPDEEARNLSVQNQATP